ncbi:Exonuclease III [Marinospirillum celere]|uniref:Exonuclease III n=1 Tax=Marinospirillum celere TaxID=1122252 RepID=A0A1I1DZ41_9GAMM|nr:Exonuclease III [Marinospirillum celere]
MNTILKATTLFLIAIFGLTACLDDSSAGSSPSTDQGLVIASWNIERLGHGTNKNYEALGQIGAQFDLIAVQELMNREGAVRLHSALEDVTGESWSKIYSEPLGRSTYTEKYAFYWRDSRVDLHESTGQAMTYLDPDDLFAREPYSARFVDLTTNDIFVLATVHIVFGSSISDRTPEIKELSNYVQLLDEVYEGDPTILLGDFNLPPTHQAWSDLKEIGWQPLITEGATTLSGTRQDFANLYDNIWVHESFPITVNGAGIFNAPAFLGWDFQETRRHVSDHTPVIMMTHAAQLRGSNDAVQLSPAPGEERDTTGMIRGNRNSQIMHRPDCPSYDRVAEHNRTYFESVEEGERAGYRLAGNCP